MAGMAVFPGVREFVDMGVDNDVAIGAGSNVDRIRIEGHRNHVRVGERCKIAGQIIIKCDGGVIEIGDETTSMGVMLHMHEASTITIGRDCMFSGGIWLDTSDNHSILDVESGRRLNPPRPIEIGDHVWIGRTVSVLKGAVIGKNSIVGAGSVVRSVIPPNCIASGVPARVVRTGVTWDRRRLPYE